MQKKLQRVDSIIRHSYADKKITSGDYLEATELLVKLNNELKLLNLQNVSNRRELLIAALKEYDEVKFNYTKLTHEDYVSKYHSNL